jgi:hypothetical protein
MQIQIEKTDVATFSDKSRNWDLKKYYPGQKCIHPQKKKVKHQTVMQIEKLPASFHASNYNLL